MISKTFYIRLITRVALLSLFALGTALAFFKESYMIAGLGFIFFLMQVSFLIKYLNQNNKKIAYFFNSVINEDFSLRFPEHGGPKTFNELHRSLNALNEKIQKVYVNHQAQEKYYLEILKQAEIGILTYNDKGHILFANPNSEFNAAISDDQINVVDGFM